MSVAASAGTIPSLDGLRAVAIGLVVTSHCQLGHIVPGLFGVSVFFLLSGFLITTLLRQEFDRHGRIALGDFYLRRLLRLMPPLFVVILATLLIDALGIYDANYDLAGLLSIIFYFANYQAITVDFIGIPLGLGITSTLAVEEHFYFIYPPLALLLMRRTDRATISAWLMGLCALVLLWRFVLLLHLQVSDNYLRMATDARVDSILFGCWLAFFANPWLKPPRPGLHRRHAMLALLGLALLLLTLLIREPWFRATLRHTVQSLGLLPVFYYAVAYPQAWPCRWLNHRGPVYLGVVSYALYLMHQVVIYAIEQNWPDVPWYGLLLLTLAICLPLCEAMRRWVERPVAGLRQKLHGRQSRRLATNAS